MTEEIHYKSAASRWFHQIPDDWHISKLKFLVNIVTGNSLNDGEKLRFSFDENPELKGYNYISSKDIDVGTSKCNYDTGIIIPTSETKYKVAPSNSTLLCIEGGSAGKKITFTTEDVCFVNKLACFKSTETTHSKFVYYFLQSNEFKNQFQSSLSGLIGGVSLTNLNDFEIPVPPLSEQTKIAAFLDQKTAQIDTIIEKKQKLLQLLDEKKKSVINEAVTKGLNPDVPMKDSGIEWIGEIPKDWSVKKIKYLSKVISKGTTPSTEGKALVDEGIRYLKSENIINNNVSRFPEFFIDEETNQLLRRSILEENDLLFVIAGASIGKTALLPKEFLPANTNQAVCFIRFKKNINFTFLHFVTMSNGFQNMMWLNAVTSAQPNLSMTSIGDFSVPIPSQKIQEKIVDFIETKIEDINLLTTKLIVQINKLQEYRQSIISEAVTGKINLN